MPKTVSKQDWINFFNMAVDDGEKYRIDDYDRELSRLFSWNGGDIPPDVDLFIDDHKKDPKGAEKFAKYMMVDVPAGRYWFPREKANAPMEPISKSKRSYREDNTSSTVPGYETPNAFGEQGPVDDGAYVIKSKDTDKFFKALGEMYDREVNKINELSYDQFRHDDSKTDRQKINLNIKEINRMLSEVERMITHASKLKTENGADSGVFWKGTVDRFTKINEKLLRLSTKIREMNA